jgi:hypothetical protein
MKARVKATGEIIEVEPSGRPWYPWWHSITDRLWKEEELDFNFKPDPDYWTKLEHQYAGMAMQGLMSYVGQITPKEGRSFCDEIVGISFKVAHALVEKMKEEE